MKTKTRLVLTAAAVILLPVLVAAGCRLRAWAAASDYGTTALKMTAGFGTPMLGNRELVRDTLSGPEFAAFHGRVMAVPFLGRDYERGMRDLEAGIIYCSEQMALPAETRFASPPALGGLKITPGDRSDQAVADTCSDLAVQYLSRLHPFIRH